MPTSGLILTLDEEPSQRARVIEWLERDPRISCGQLQGAHLPVAAQTDTLEAGIALVRDELPTQPGISFVHVVCVDFEDADYNQEPAQPPTDRRRRAPEESEI